MVAEMMVEIYQILKMHECLHGVRPQGLLHCAYLVQKWRDAAQRNMVTKELNALMTKLSFLWADNQSVVIQSVKYSS